LIEIVLIQRYEILIGSPVVTFSSVLGTLLVFSGLGSLWSGRLTKRNLNLTLILIVLLLLIQQLIIPMIFPFVLPTSLLFKVFFTLVMIAPLGFFMGVPFPYILRIGKKEISKPATAMLYTANAVLSAVAVPLAFNLSTSCGIGSTFITGIVIYLFIWLLITNLGKKGNLKVINPLALLLILVIMIAPWLFTSTSNSIMQSGKKAEVFALKYGKSYKRESTIFENGSRKEKASFAWMFWLVRSEGRNILVDTGFNDMLTAIEEKISNYRFPKSLLADMNMRPENIDDVILTHLHWDHAGSLELYSEANIWLQRSEYEYAKTKVNENIDRKKGFRWEIIELLDLAAEEGRLKLIDDTEQLTEEVSMHLAPGHTPGLQYVKIATIDGNVILASDNTYLYKNNQRNLATGSAYSAEDNLKSIKEMQKWAGSPYLIIPGHDPRVFRYFPEIADNIVKIQIVED